MRFLYIIFLYIRLQPDGQVSIRDGAFSVFDKSKFIEEFGPTLRASRLIFVICILYHSSGSNVLFLCYTGLPL